MTHLSKPLPQTEKDNWPAKSPAMFPGVCESILDTVGNTPAVRVGKLAPEGVDLYVKLEAFNPLGSVKDRLALGVIEAAERDGTLKPGQTVVEATSGNTGIGLAMVCARKGYPLVVTMAENFSVERRRLMRYLGARVILTPAAEKGSGMLNKARELADKHGWFLCRQFENEANPDMHSRTTAPEILAAFGETGLDHWVTGFGTGGTLKGVARVLKARSPATQIVAAEPDNSPLLGGGIAQDYLDDGGPAASHPSFRPHLMQGWSPDFIPKLTNDVLRAGLVDRIEPVGGAEALEGARALARQEGIFCGITGGATFAAALRIAREAEKGARILAMIPDTGERYLSTPLFDDISDTMSADEEEIAASTPSYRFDIPSQPAPASGDETVPEPTEKARKYLERVISDPDNPVVLFALEWCEFCWSVRVSVRPPKKSTDPVAEWTVFEECAMAAIVLDHEQANQEGHIGQGQRSRQSRADRERPPARAQITTKGSRVTVSSKMLRERIGSRYLTSIHVHSEACNRQPFIRSYGDASCCRVIHRVRHAPFACSFGRAWPGLLARTFGLGLCRSLRDGSLLHETGFSKMRCLDLTLCSFCCKDFLRRPRGFFQEGFRPRFGGFEQCVGHREFCHLSISLKSALPTGSFSAKTNRPVGRRPTPYRGTSQDIPTLAVLLGINAERLTVVRNNLQPIFDAVVRGVAEFD